MKKFLTFVAAALVLCACSQPAKEFAGKVVSVAADNSIVVVDSANVAQSFIVPEGMVVLPGCPVVVKYTGNLNDTASVKATEIACDSTYVEAIGTWMNAESAKGFKVDPAGVVTSVNCDSLILSSWELTGTPHAIVVKGMQVNPKDTTAVENNITIAGNTATDQSGAAYTKQE
jgi:hypothetical protein